MAFSADGRKIKPRFCKNQVKLINFAALSVHHHMKICSCCTFLFFLFTACIPGFSQNGKRETWSRVRVMLDAGKGMRQLSALGVETDHGQHKPGRWFVSDFSGSELRRIREAGFITKVLIDDVQEDYLRRKKENEEKSVQSDFFLPSCNRTGNYNIPVNWSLGSMGGHLTYKEMLNHLDSMRRKFPALISMRMPVDTGKTANDSSIWYVRITDLPQSNEPAEPKALFTAVHHAREPVGMHQLIFFMWYLLENYAGNDEIKNMLNNSDLYFVPCLNPDGYIFNQQEYPDGGGMWRKNRFKNADFSYGVDLNRNYGYRWGVDDFGSSPEPSSDVYRGASPFSEPETRGIKKFCEQHQFRLALNYHTFANILLHPWGYNGETACPDSAVFRTLGAELTKENNFRVGNCLELLNYNSNGSSDDYMYAAFPEKPPVLAMTPEVGNQFWPSQNEILPLCLKTLHQNLSAVRALHPMISFTDSTGVFCRPGFGSTAGDPRLLFKITRTGSNSLPANFTITFSCLGIDGNGLPPVVKTYSGLQMGETITDSVMLPANLPLLINPSLISWEVKINNQVFETTDTIHHRGGIPFSNENLLEKCETLSNWQGPWIVAGDSPQEGSGNLKTSEGNYQPGQSSFMRRNRFYDLRSPDILAGEMSFWTRYGIEKNYDMAALEFSTDSGASWISVCTDKTKPSSPFSNQAGIDVNGQDTIRPVWDGFQPVWRKEVVDLSDFLGNKLYFRFHFRSDDFTEYSGFEVDNIRLRLSYTITSMGDAVYVPSPTIHISPNPASSGSSEIILNGFTPGRSFHMNIKDAAGRQLKSNTVVNGPNKVSCTGLAPGCYFIEIQEESGSLLRKRWLIN